MRHWNLRNFAAWLTGVPCSLLVVYLWFADVEYYNAFILYLFGLLILAGVVLAIADVVVTQRHHRESQQLAENLGWNFQSGSARYSNISDRFPFKRGQTQHQENVIWGSWNGIPCATFTYHRELGGHSMISRDLVFQVTRVELPVALPYIELVPERMADKFSKAFGGQDLDVESAAFNRAWRVLYDDRRYAHAVLHPRLVERLLTPAALNTAIRIEGGSILAWQPGWQDPATLAERLSMLASVARHVPEMVVREYGQEIYPTGQIQQPVFSADAPDWAVTPGALITKNPTNVPVGPPMPPGQTKLRGDGIGEVIFDIFALNWTL